MKAPKNTNQNPFMHIGLLLTSATIMAAFTYSGKEKIKKELSDVQAVQLSYTIEKEKKPEEKKHLLEPKKKNPEKTTTLNKSVTSDAKKTKNSNKSINTNVSVKGLDITFNPDPNYKIINVAPIIVDFPDKEAVFMGGYSAMNKYINHNLKLNKLYNLINKDEFLVNVEFIVSENGQIVEVIMKETVALELKNEVYKLMMGMPNWVPAELNGRKVSTRVFLPIRIYFQ